MAETLARFQAEDEAKQRELKSPASMQEREESSDSFSGLSGAEAEELLTTQFSSEIEALNAEPAKVLSEAHLIRPLGEGGALISDEGRTKLIEGTAPVLAPEGGGKIDLSLESIGDGYQPANPIVDLEIPGSADEGVVVGEEGLEVSQAGAEGESAGHVVEGLNVFYPEVHTDTDLLISPTATGVELFDQLRSERSPEELRFHLEMPEGAQLRASGNAAEVVAADGSKLADIPPPAAVDAQGTEVPVHLHTEGDSLVLNVKRSPGEFAYPILLDPIIEEWYWANWYEGYNLQALEPGGPWHWNTSEGPTSSYVYGSTSCIFTCWAGSHRGLYMSTPSGTIPANRWGQWSYSAPNSETYLENAWVSPYWRDDHVNCPSSIYSQPYDYVGMWNQSSNSYNRILYNESTKNNNQGAANLESWGNALIIGMGVSSEISGRKCWRDVMAGGTRIWLEDYSRPTLTTSSSGQWMDTSPLRLNVSAYDAGLGVQKFKATATNSAGTTSEWWTNSSCTGLSGAPCPHTWNLNESSQPQLNFSPSALPEGIDKLSVTAYDAAEKPSFTTNEMTARVDHSAPTIAFSGTLTEQEALGTEKPTYKVKVVALDGDPNAKPEETTKIRSGVVSLETEIDGELIEKFVPECAGEPNCGAEEEIGFQAAKLSAGQHTFKARAVDAFGHITPTKELKFTISPDRTGPRIGAGPLPGTATYVEAFGTVGSGQLNHPADVALDSKGNVWALDKGNNRIEEFNEKGEFVRTVGSFGATGGRLSAPAGFAVDASGNIWVADTANNRIEEFNEKGEFILLFGKEVNKTKVEAGGTEAEKSLCTAASGNVCKAGVPGSGNGQLNAPQGIAAMSGGDLWIADTGNNRIQKFGPNGNFLSVVTGENTTAGKMKEPSSVAMGPDGSIWVADSGWNRIEQWTPTLALQRICGGEGTMDGQFQRLGALDVDAQGNVWAADITDNDVQEFSEACVFVGRFGVTGSSAGQLSLASPTGVTADAKGNIWIADGNNNRVQKWVGAEAPSYSNSFGTAGSGNGQFAHPAGIATDSGGSIWVVDENNKRVEQFSAAGQYLSSFGSAGTGNGQFGRPTDLAIDAKGNLWVTDAGNNRVEEFNKNGEYMRQIGSLGTGNGQFKGPESIATDPKGNIWVGDTYNGRLQRFNENGELIKVVVGTGSAQLIEPTGIAIDPGGNVWVADWGAQRVEEFAEDGTYLRQLGSAGTANGQFKHPDVVEVDSMGNVWVGDEGNSRLQEFNERGEFLAKLGGAGTGPGQFSFSWPMGIAFDKKGDLWIADTGSNRMQKWTVPALHIGPVGGAIAASATDKSYGVTSLRLKLVNEAEQVETLDSASQSCPDGGCSMTSIFEGLDLFERPAGVYTLMVEATDGAGNSSRAASRFTLDPGPPQLTLAGPLAEGAGQPMSATAGELAISASETDAPTSGIRKIGVEVDNEPVASSAFGCAAGCQEVATAYRYNAARDGADRSIESAATPSGAASKALNGVACLSASDCTAVGYYQTGAGFTKTLVERWNGSAWQIISSPNPGMGLVSKLESVSCISASSCTAVGYYLTATGYSTFVESWNGTTWSIVSSPNATGFARNYLYGVSCASASNCWAVGKSAYTPEEEAAGKTPKALLERWNGSEWTTATASLPPSQLKAVSCFSATFCMAFSGLPGSLGERWNGTSWSFVVSPSPSGGSAVALSGVACTAESTCTAVGSYSVNGHTAPLAARWSGTGWTVQKTPDPSAVIEEVTAGSLAAVSCWGSEACTAVGSRSAGSESAPLIEGWDGTDWALEPAPAPSGTSTATLNGAACVEAFNCYAVGSKAGMNALIEREVPDSGSKTVTVEATDRYGNSTTRSIDVDVPKYTSETPSCNQEATSVAPKAVITGGEATNALQESVPAAVEPSVATTNEANGEEVDPTYSQPQPNLESLGTPTKGETEITPEGGFTIKGVACISPATLTTAATEAKVVNGDAAVFANTAPETDTLLRPNAAGVTMVQSLRGSSAPTTISWNVTLNPNENLVELPSGAVAITREGTEATGETPEVVEPEGMRSPEVLKDAELQLETSQYHLIEAESETSEEVIAVIPRPWVILSQGSIMPLKIEIEPDVEVPTEFTMTYEYPPFELNFIPEAVVTEVDEAGGATASVSAAGCPNGSPCGTFAVSAAVSYAKYWGKAQRNHDYPDFGSNNCTNFLSQIMAHGGMGYMRYGEEEVGDYRNGQWWMRKVEREPGVNIFLYTYSWSVADVLPRHLWQYGLVRIDTSNEPSGWQTGDILTEDWYHTNGKGDFNHMQFVSGTQTAPGGMREPLIANSSEPAENNYAARPWNIYVKKKIEAENPEGWNRVPLVPKRRWAVWNEKDAKKHDPDNLYNAGGVFQE